MKIGTKTMIGNLEGVRYHGKHYTVEGEYSNPCLSRDEFRAVMLPRLTKKERKYYDELKKEKNGDKRKMVSRVNFDVMNSGLGFTYESYYKIIVAIVKGGYNHD